MIHSNNLIPVGTDTSNGYVSGHFLESNGNEFEYSDYHISEYFEVTPNLIYEYYCINRVSNPSVLYRPSICFYTANKTFISGVAFNGNVSVSVTCPANAKYARASVRETSWLMQFGLDISAYIKAGNEQHLRIRFEVDGGRIDFTEENIYSNGITYTEVMNGDTDLTIGKAVCSSIYIPLINDGSFADFNFRQKFSVALGVDIGNRTYYYNLGVFIGEKPKRMLGDTIELIGYDLMTLFEADAKDFLTSLTYPMTIGEIFDALCAYYGVTGDREMALNTSRQITAPPFDGNGITGRDVLSWIAEACGCYARMNRVYEKCELVWYTPVGYKATANDYYTLDVMEYDVEPIDQVRVQVTEQDIGVNYPTNGDFEHSYAIVDNPFLYTDTASSLNSCVTNLYNRLHGFSVYTPCNVYTDGNWLIQCGDIITVVDLDDTTQIKLPVFSLVLNWSGRADSTFESTGSEYREPVTVVQKQMIRQNYRYHEIEIDIDELRSEIVASSFHIYVQKEDPIDTVGREELHKGDLWVFPGLETWADVKYKNYQHTVLRNWEEIWNSTDHGYAWFQLFSKTQCWDGSQWIVVSDPIMIAEQSSRIEQTENRIELEVRRANSAEGQLRSAIDMTAEQLLFEVNRSTSEDSELASRIQMTQSSINLEVTRATEAEGRLEGRIEITEGAIELEVERASTEEGRLSGRIDVTEGSIETEVLRATEAEGTLQSNIEQTAEDIRLGVKSSGKVSTVGSYILIQNDKITLNSGGQIEIKAGSTFTVASGNFNIDANGNVTMTGQINANTGKIGGWYVGTDYLGNKNTKASSSIGLHALETGETAGDTYVIWAGSSNQANANFSVKGDGTVAIKKGSLTIGNNFAVASDGTLTAKAGTIGSGNSVWHIGSKSIYNGTQAMDDNTQGIYLGTDGIRVVGDDNHKFHVESSTGNVIIRSGMTDFNDTTNNGSFFHSSLGWVLGGGKFKVTNDGTITAKLGTVGGWTIGSNYIGNANTREGSSVGLYVTNSATSTVFWIGGTMDRPTTWTAVYNSGSTKWSDIKADSKTWNDYMLPPFRVLKNGKMYSTGGQIGGWTINAHDLTSSSVGFSSNANVVLWVGASSASSAPFCVKRNGDVQIKRGSIQIGGSSSSPNFQVTDEGVVTIKEGSVNIKSGYIQIGGKFSVDDSGVMQAVDATLTSVTAKSGYIGNGSSGWAIGSKSIWNGRYALNGDAGAGTYIGTDGFITLKDGNHWVSISAGTGNITVNSGMTSVDDTSTSSGMFIGSTGIALGGGKFKVTSAGSFVAKEGYIGNGNNGWHIGNTSLYNGTDSLTSTTAGIYLGVDGIYIYKDASHNVKIAKSTGVITAMGGKTGINLASANQTTGVYIGSDGIALGRVSTTSGGTTTYSDAFNVTSSGYLTAKYGKISNWNIGNKSLYNGTDSLSSTIAGLYLGTDGIRLYKDAQHVFFIDVANGSLIFRSGVDSITDTTHTTGTYIGYNGIMLGGGRFKVDTSGYLTAKNGSIAGWTIGTNSLAKIDRSGTTVVSHVGMSTSGSVAFYAGQAESASNCAFKVTNTGKVYLTTLYTRVVDESAQGYDPDDPNTWTWIDSQIDLGTNAYKIGSGYKTIKSVSGGRVRLSDGSSFDTATSVYMTASWSSGTAQYVNTFWGTAVIATRSPSNPSSTIETHTVYINEDAENNRIDVNCVLFGTGDDLHKYLYPNAIIKNAVNSVEVDGGWTTDGRYRARAYTWVAGFKSYNGHDNYSLKVNAGFFAGGGQYDIQVYTQDTGGNKTTITGAGSITNYKLGFSTSEANFASTTKGQIQNSSGTKYSNTPELDLSTYWTKAMAQGINAVNVEGTGWSGGQYTVKAYTGSSTHTYTGAQASSPKVNAGFFASNGQYDISVYTESGGNRSTVSGAGGITNYKLGFSTSSANFSSSTKGQIQNSSGTRYGDTPELSLSDYWSTARTNGWTGCYNTVKLNYTTNQTITPGSSITIWAMANNSPTASSASNVTSITVTASSGYSNHVTLTRRKASPNTNVYNGYMYRKETDGTYTQLGASNSYWYTCSTDLGSTKTVYY